MMSAVHGPDQGDESVRDPVGPWTLERALGAGSFSTTWLASDASGRKVALKLLTEAPGDELRALARLAHPAIPALIDSGTDAVPWIAMEVAEGTPLHLLKELDVDVIVEVFCTLFDALAAVHRSGLVHGDVKPHHVLVDEVEPATIRLIDFGMVGLAGGTPDYASPEQLCGAGPSAKGDVYAAGVSLWQALHGALPFDERSQADRLRARLEDDPVPRSGPPWLRELLVGLLDRDPERRHSASHAADALAARARAVPHVDLQTLARRASCAHVPRSAVDERVAGWVANGGVLSLNGRAGSGRTHMLRWAEVELRARSCTVAWMVPGVAAWSPVEALLTTSALAGSSRALPDGDVLARAEAAACAIVTRARGPFWLLVDDLDALDEGSRLVLNELIKLNGVHVLAAGDVQAEQLNLPQLDRTAIDALAAAVLGEGDMSPALDVIESLASGRADRVVQGLVSAVRHGALVRPVTVWVVDETRLQRIETGENTVLDGVVGEVAAALATARSSLSMSALLQVCQQPPDEIAGAVEHLLRVGLVRRDGRKLTIVEGPTARSVRSGDRVDAALHVRLLDALDRQGVSDPVRLARHAAGAMQVDRVAEVALRGVARLETIDPGAARELAEACARCWPDARMVACEVRLIAAAGQGERAIERAKGWLAAQAAVASQTDVRLALVSVLASSGERYEEAWHTLNVARASLDGSTHLALDLTELGLLFRQGRHQDVVHAVLRGAHGDARHQVRVGLLHAQSLHALGNVEQGLAKLDSLVELAVDGDQRGLVHGVQARLLWHSGRVAEAAAMLELAHEHALSAVTRARMANNAGLAYYSVGELQRALSAWERAILLFDRLGLRADLVRALVNIVVGYGDAGRWARSQDAGERAMRLAADVGLPQFVAMAAGNLGDVHLHRGEFDTAQGYYEQARVLAVEHGLSGELVELARRSAQVAVLQEEPDALRLVDVAHKAAIDAGNSEEAARGRALRALCLARAGQGNEALELVDDDMRQLREAGAARELAEHRLWRARVLVELGRAEDCLEDIAQVQAYANEADLGSLRTRAERIRVRAEAIRPARVESDLERLLMLTAELGRHLDLQPLLEQSAHAARELIGSERAFVVFGDHSGWRVAARSVAEQASTERPSGTVLRRAMERGRPVVVTDLAERAMLRGAESVIAMDLRFVVCIPLVERDVVLGALYVDGRAVMDRGLECVERLLTALALHISVAVSRVHADERARRRARQAVDVARDVRGMLMVIEANAQDVLLDLTPEQTQPVRAMQDVLLANDRVQRMLGSLLATNRVVHPEVVLARVVEKQIALLSNEARTLGVMIEPELDDRLRVKGDVDDLSRLASHLIARGLRASRAGDDVHVRLRALGDNVVFEVQDQAPRDQSHSGVARYSDMMDMEVVRGVVEDHDGTLRNVCDGEGGARIVVELPRFGS